MLSERSVINGLQFWPGDELLKARIIPKWIEHAVHRVARRRIGRFRRPHKIELHDALDVLIILFRQSQSHGVSIFTHLVHYDKGSAP